MLNLFSNLWTCWVFRHNLEFKIALWVNFLILEKTFENFLGSFGCYKEKENEIFQENVTNCLRKNFYQEGHSSKKGKTIFWKILSQLKNSRILSIINQMGKLQSCILRKSKFYKFKFKPIPPNRKFIPGSRTLMK